MNQIIRKIKDGLFAVTVKQGGNQTGVTGSRVRSDKSRNGILAKLIGLMRSVTTDTILEFDERFKLMKDGTFQFKHKGETVDLNLIPYYKKPFRFYKYVVRIIGIKKVSSEVRNYFNNGYYSNPFSFHKIDEIVRQGGSLPRPIIRDEPCIKAKDVSEKMPYRVEYRDHFPKIQVRFSDKVKRSANDLADIPQRRSVFNDGSYGVRAIRGQMQTANFTMVFNVCSYGVTYDDKYRIESYSTGCDRNNHRAEWGYNGKTTTLKPHLKRLVEKIEGTIDRAENNRYWTERNSAELNKNDAIFGGIYSDTGLKAEEDKVRDLVALPVATGEYNNYGYIATKDGAKLCIVNGGRIKEGNSFNCKANFIGFHISFSEATGFYTMDNVNSVPGFDKMAREDIVEVIKIMIKGVDRNFEKRIPVFVKCVEDGFRIDES